MTDTTMTTRPAKRARNGSVILTDRMCEKRVTQRNKIYDRKCPGLYISRTISGMATFNFKFTHPTTGKQRSIKIGEYNPETFGVDHARSKVYAMKAMDPAGGPSFSRRNRLIGPRKARPSTRSSWNASSG